MLLGGGSRAPAEREAAPCRHHRFPQLWALGWLLPVLGGLSTLGLPAASTLEEGQATRWCLLRSH